MSEFKLTIEDILGESGELVIEKELACRYGYGVSKSLDVICTDEGFVFKVTVHNKDVYASTSLQSAVTQYNNHNGLKE